MSLSVFEITAIPTAELYVNNAEEAINQISVAFQHLLNYIASTSVDEDSAIEILLHKEQGTIRPYLTFRQKEMNEHGDTADIFENISRQLTDMHYSVKKVEDKSLQSLVEGVQRELSGRTVALTKCEHTVYSPMSYSGYYYYSDIFDVDQKDTPKMGNYVPLFNQLMSCESAVVMIQLIPTAMHQEELFAVSNLSAELSKTTRGLMVGNQWVSDAVAQSPCDFYGYYTGHATQPMFLYNMVVASAHDDTASLAAAFKSSLQDNMPDTVTLKCVEVSDPILLAKNFFRLPWDLYEQLSTYSRDLRVWNGSAFQPVNLMRFPYMLSLSEAKNIFRLPIDDGQIRGLHSTRIVNDNEMLSENVLDKNNIIIGKLINDSINIGASTDDFTRHALVVGVPGSGKTTFAMNMLLQFYQKEIPFLIIEPTKTEYRALIDHVTDLQIFTPGKSDVVPFIINPFIPPKGIHLEQYIPSLVSAFKAAFSMETPLDIIFQDAIMRCYAQYGWKRNSTCDDKDVLQFGLFEFIRTFKHIIRTSKYDPDLKNNIETGGTFRLLNLIDQNRHIYDNINSISIDELLQKPTVLELNAIADAEQKSLVMALLLISICLYTKNEGSTGGKIRRLLMIDEAHVLLDAEGKNDFTSSNKAQKSTVRSLQSMIAEIRSFGTGIIIADQKPSKVTNDIVADTDIKVAFRLVEQNERKLIADSTNMSAQQSEHLARLKKFEAFVYYEKLESSKIIMTPNIRAEKKIRDNIPDEEIKLKSRFWRSREEKLIPYYECRACNRCHLSRKCNQAVRIRAEYYADHILATQKTPIPNVDVLKKYMFRLHDLVIAYERRDTSGAPIKLLCNCTKIHFIRQVLLESNFYASRNEIMKLLSETLFKEDANA